MASIDKSEIFRSFKRRQTCPLVHFVWPDPTQPISWLTQPNPIQVEKFGPNPTQPNTTNNGAYSIVLTKSTTSFYTQNLSRTFSQPSINLFVFFTDHYTY